MKDTEGWREIQTDIERVCKEKIKRQKALKKKCLQRDSQKNSEGEKKAERNKDKKVYIQRET